MRITFPGEFTTLNEFIAAINLNRYAGNEVKRSETDRVAIECRNSKLPPIRNYPVMIWIHWRRKDKRQDPDNVSFAIKFILDGMIQSGILEGDGWKYISRIEHTFSVDKLDPCVILEIREPSADGPRWTGGRS